MDPKYLKSNTDITLILTYATQISRLCENVIIDMQLTKDYKTDFKDSITAAKKIHSLITSITNYKMRKDIHERTTNNYDTGAFDNIMFTIGQMSDEQRNLADEVLSEILNNTLKINRENDNVH
jgi:hypothetical protein